MFLRALILFCVATLITFPVAAAPSNAEATVKRSVLAVYDSVVDGSPAFTKVHKLFEMPLNYLGYTVDYADIKEALPQNQEKYAAIMVAVPDASIHKKEAMAWLNWLDDAQKKGVKLIILGGVGLGEDVESDTQAKTLEKLIYKHIGVFLNNEWINVTYGTKTSFSDEEMLNFERSIGGVFPPYSVTTAINGGKSHLRVVSHLHEDTVSDLVITHPNGGYVADGYLVYDYEVEGKTQYNQWYINPFQFLRSSLDIDSIPKPDATTINGRRIFYSHIDGDGWNNYAEFRKDGDKRKISAEVIRDEVIKKYTSLPFTVSVIAHETMPDCYGLPFSEQVARDIFALPNVEPSSHTLSHPLYWGFFADYSVEKEKAYIDKYPPPPNKKFFLSELLAGKKADAARTAQRYKPDATANVMRGISSPYIEEKDIMKDYDTPRSFACTPFSLGDEIGGSIAYVKSLAGGKPVKLYQWSGDTRPFEAALAEVRLNGAYNLNGGGSRYDLEAPSYTLVAAIGAPVGKERQIYASNTNENDYTDLWTRRFFGFRYLKATIENTETPLRIHPFNIYFHSYSAQKQASLTALQENMDYAVSQPIFPIFASEYAAIANSFYKTKLVKLGNRRWLVQNRGALQTIRFDQASLLAVDINDSKGVLGYKYLHGSLYVSLDKAVNNPVISLSSKKTLGGMPDSKTPYLIESNATIKNLKYIKNRLTFQTSGLSSIDMLWKQPSAGKYTIQGWQGDKVVFKDVLSTDKDHILRIKKDIALKDTKILITPSKN